MLQTNRLVIRPYQDKDQEVMIELLTNDQIKETYMIPDFDTKEDAIAMFHKLQQYSLSEEHYEFGIYLKGQPIGNIKVNEADEEKDKLIGFVNDVDIKDSTIELGYVIHPDYHGIGYATEMFAAVIEDLFQRGFKEVITGAFFENKASIRVMEKCNMTLMDQEDDIYYHGRIHHCVYYSKKI